MTGEQWLLHEDAQALERFNETCEDGQPYDIPKTRMRRLAELGVIQWCGGSRYSLTAFGQYMLDLLPEGWPRLPLKTQADHDAYQHALVENGTSGVAVSSVSSMQFDLIDAARALQSAAEHVTPELGAVYKARAAKLFDVVSALAHGVGGNGYQTFPHEPPMKDSP